MIQKLIQARKEYVGLLRRELLGPGSEISVPDEAHELISSAPDKRYSVGILFPRDIKMGAENDDAFQDGNDETEMTDDGAEDAAQEDSIGREKQDGGESASGGEKDGDGMDEEISLATQNVPSSAGITFLARGNTDHVACRIRFGTYHAALPGECRVPFRVEHPEQVRVPLSLEAYVRYDMEEQCFRTVGNGLTGKLISDSRHADPACAEDGYDVYEPIYRLNDQIRRGYVRDPHEAEVVLDFTNGDYCDGTGDGIDGIPVRVSGLRRRWHDDIWSVTVMLVNDSKDLLHAKQYIPGEDKWKVHPAIFQPEITVSTEKNDFVFLAFGSANDLSAMDEEERSLELQYRNRKNYANGLGAAAGWEIDGEGRGYVCTDFFPAREMPRMDFGIPKASNIDPTALSMKYLSDMDKTSRGEKLQKLQTIVSAYQGWAAEKRKEAETIDGELREVAFHNIAACEKACARIRAGIETLASNDKAWDAFQLANRAMFMQRVHIRLQEETSNVARFRAMRSWRRCCGKLKTMDMKQRMKKYAILTPGACFRSPFCS